MLRAISVRRISGRFFSRLSRRDVLMARTLSSDTMSRSFCSCALHWHFDSVSWQKALRCVAAVFAMESAMAAESTAGTGVAFAVVSEAAAESGAGSGTGAGCALAGVIAGIAAFGSAQVLQLSLHSMDMGAIGSTLCLRVRESTVNLAALISSGSC